MQSWAKKIRNVSFCEYLSMILLSWVATVCFSCHFVLQLLNSQYISSPRSQQNYSASTEKYIKTSLWTLLVFYEFDSFSYIQVHITTYFYQFLSFFYFAHMIHMGKPSIIFWRKQPCKINETIFILLQTKKLSSYNNGCLLRINSVTMALYCANRLTLSYYHLHSCVIILAMTL